jgi:hypothetical protein
VEGANMNKIWCIAILFAGAFLLTSCATSMPVGTVFTQVKLPVIATGADTSKPLKVGTAQCQSVLSLIAIGDASIEAAKQNGKIKKVTHVDWEAENILGIIGTYKVTVYGY